MTVTPSASLTPAETTETAAEPTRPAQHELLAVETYGSFSSGHTLELPDGLWFDTGSADLIDQVHDLLVTSEGQGRPTLSRQAESRPVMTLKGCDSVTFRKVRFGYDSPDWPDGTVTGDIPLVVLTDCISIRFEDCEFFGSSGSGLVVSASENIILKNCTFYNNAGVPLESGDAWLPSQIRCTDCLFETVGSGYLPLNVRDSVFDRCEWIGRRGYRVPIAAMSGDEAADSVRRLGRQTLPGQLAGILAGRVDYHADASRAITCQNNLFASQEVFALFSRMEKSLTGLLPDGTTGWALTGQKDEETAPGQILDPTLGLQLAICTATDPAQALQPATEATTEQPATTGSGEPAESSESSETAAPAVSYTVDNLIEDLEPLATLAPHLDPLITGTVHINLTEQNNRNLLALDIPVASLASWIDPQNSSRLIAQGRIILYHPDLAPAIFCQRENAGYFTAGHLTSLLRDALCISGAPLALYPETGTCLIENRLTWLGTMITDTAALHRYKVSIERTASQSSSGLDAASLELAIATIEIRADDATRRLIDPSNQTAQAFQLPDASVRDLISQALQAPVLADQGAGQVSLTTIAAFTDDPAAGMPIFILTSDPEQLTVQTVLYDDACRPVRVELTLLLSAENQWQPTACTLLDP